MYLRNASRGGDVPTRFKGVLVMIFFLKWQLYPLIEERSVYLIQRQVLDTEAVAAQVQVLIYI